MLRYKVLSQIAGNMMDNDEYVFSPVTHGHAVEMCCERTIDYHKWMAHGLIMLDRCEVLFVATLPGWRESSGVQLEIAMAKSKNIPIQYISLGEIQQMIDNQLYEKILELEA